MVFDQIFWFLMAKTRNEGVPWLDLYLEHKMWVI